MILLILSGIASGVISGMGIGGGAILIPVLTVFFGISQHTAQCTNLYYFIPTAVAALAIHIRRKSVAFGYAVPIACFGVVSAICGSYLAAALSAGVLKKLFAVFLFGMGLDQFFAKKG